MRGFLRRPAAAGGAALLLLGATYGVYRWCSAHEGRQPPSKLSKQKRRELERSRRRERKDARLQAKKAARSEAAAIQNARMTKEQRREKRERICMQRVEQYQKMEDGRLHGLRVVVDLSFLKTQTPREHNSVLKQLACVYGYLRSCPLDRVLSLRLASCTDELSAVCVQHGVPSWKIWRHEEPLEQVYSTGELVYLSPDSDHVLKTIDPAKVYVVGGIVDRSVRKGETMVKAVAQGLQSARLPLQEHFEAAGEPVRTHILNVDAVLVTLNEVANHGDWGRAFARAVPPRIARRKGSKGSKASNHGKSRKS